MPGPFGYTKNVNNGGSDVFLHSMANEVNSGPNLNLKDFFFDDAIAASANYLLYDNQPSIYKNIHIWTDGIIYNLGECADFLGKTEVTANEALLIAYKQKKLESLLKIVDGYFVAVIYDKENRQIKTISDRYGMRPLYYYFDGVNFAWCSEVKGLINLPFVNTSVNEEAIRCFMELGYLVGDITLHDQIKLIPPSSILSFDVNKKLFSCDRYWSWSEIKQQRVSFPVAVDKLYSLIINAIKIRVSKSAKVGVPLSGGLDSRLLFAAINNIHSDYKGYCYTFGDLNSIDVHVAKLVTQKTSWLHDIFELKSDNWFEPRIDRIWFTDGMLNMEHMHGIRFMPDIKSNDINILVNGYAGDAILGPTFLGVHSNKRITYSIAEKHYKKFTHLADVDSEFYDTPHIEPNLFMNRVRRFTNMGIVNASYDVEQVLPFMDNNVIEFIFSIDDNYRLDNKLYSAMLLKYFPEYFNNIPWQKTGRTIDGNEKIELPNHLVKSFSNYAAWIKDTPIATKLKTILEYDTSFYSKYTEENWYEMYLSPHLDQGMNRSNKILRAATIEIYLSKVFSKID